jgi:cytochrome d ubiquinol oxidase subunit I
MPGFYDGDTIGPHMSDLLAARSQMAMSLAFHILFAVAGIAMPLLMVIAEDRWIRKGDAACRELAHRWAHGTAILFAVGAVSGTVLSFELGLLWPTFMRHAGPIFGMPFSLEGFAFFVEAIFLGVYLYGWERVSPRAHWFAGVMVAVSGAMANAAAPTEVLHMALAAYVSVGFAVAGIHAWLLLKDPADPLHRRALAIALAVGGTAAVLQPLSGDLSAKHVARHQPVKFAAMEGHFRTERGAAAVIGGWPDEERMETRWALRIPYLMSVLAFGDPHAEVKGLEEFPRDEWPPVAIVHLAFQVMVGCGTVLALVSVVGAFLAWRRKAVPLDGWYLKTLVACAPLGMIALEAGWTVTEVGRQPWIIRGVMRTADAVTPMPGLVVPFATFTLLYLVLGIVVVALLKRQVFGSSRALRPPTQAHRPAGPT